MTPDEIKAAMGELLTPEALAFLLAFRPPEDANDAYRIGYYMGLAASQYIKVGEVERELAHANQKVHELAADA